MNFVLAAQLPLVVVELIERAGGNVEPPVSKNRLMMMMMITLMMMMLVMTMMAIMLLMMTLVKEQCPTWTVERTVPQCRK